MNCNKENFYCQRSCHIHHNTLLLFAFNLFTGLYIYTYTYIHTYTNGAIKKLFSPSAFLLCCLVKVPFVFIYSLNNAYSLSLSFSYSVSFLLTLVQFNYKHCLVIINFTGITRAILQHIRHSFAGINQAYSYIHVHLHTKLHLHTTYNNKI